MAPVLHIAAEARAKVNLSLELLGVRPDGYHELRSVVQSLALHDDVEVDCASGVAAPHGGEPGVAVSCVSDGVDISRIGPASGNLCAKAVEAFLARMPAGAASRAALGRVRVRVVKRIPLGGGLGGGSADAAATLRALNAIAGADALPADALLDAAAAVGSDVPALLLGGTVLMEGRGERVSRPAFTVPPLHVVLANCGAHVSTACAYGEFDRIREAENLGPRARGAWNHEPAAGANLGYADVAAMLQNDLETPVFALCPEVAATAQALRRAGADAVLMSGSGATVFALARSAEEAHGIADALPQGLWHAVTRFAP